MKITPTHNILVKQNIFNNLIEYKDTRYPDSIFYHKNNKLYFELEINYDRLWCDSELVWRFFSNENTLEYSETQRVIENMAGMYTNWGSVTPEEYDLTQTICLVKGGNVYQLASMKNNKKK